MKIISTPRAFFFFLMLLVPTAAGQDPVQELLDEARSAFESKAFEEGTEKLHEASRMVDQLEDPALASAVSELARKYDKRFEARRKAERAVAASILKLARKYLDAGFPFMAKKLYERSECFNPALSQEILERAEVVISNRNENSAGAIQDETFWEHYKLLAVMRTDVKPSKKKNSRNGNPTLLDLMMNTQKLLKDDKLYKDNIKVHRDAVKRIYGVAKDYNKAKWYETAHTVLEPALELGLFYRDKLVDKCRKIVDDHKKALEELNQAEEDERYERRFKSHMLNFKNGHKKLGKVGGWKIGEREIVAPRLQAHYAMVVSNTRVGPEYTIEVEIQYPDVRGYCCLVFAYHDTQNFLALEFERIKSNGFMRICWFKEMKKKVLAETNLGNTFKNWHPFSVKISGHEATACIGRSRVTAELPAGRDASGAYGFFRPAHPFEIRSNTKGYDARFRNLFVSEP